jgi:UDP-GlcNAc:undecaprenyl-phosphate GlcNAc-1-phosphate transferase
MEGKKRISALMIFYPIVLLVFVTLVIPLFRSWFIFVGLRWLYILLFSVSLSYALTPVMRWIALRYDIIDIPDQRKIHSEATPLLGGLAIIISFSASLMANMLFDKEVLVLLSGGVIVGVVGAIDDCKGLSARLKLLVQVILVLILVHSGIVLHLLPAKTWWGFSCNVILTVIWIVGLTNAMNFFDGMDGLATGLSGIIAIFMGIVAFQTDQPFMGWIAIAMLGSCLGFFPYNFRLKSPAAIYLGDAGSTFLGFVLSALAVKGDWAENSRIVAFATPTLIFWVLIFDMGYITVERVMTGKIHTIKEWIDYVGKDHLHHRLYNILGDKRKAVLTIFLLSAILGLSSIVLRNARMIDGILLVLQAFILVSVISIIENASRRN